MQRAKDKQARYYNRGTRKKPQVSVQQTVRAKVNDAAGWAKAEVIEKLPYNSYRIETETGAQYRRNRRHIRVSNEPPIVRNESVPDTVTTPFVADQVNAQPAIAAGPQQQQQQRQQQAAAAPPPQQTAIVPRSAMAATPRGNDVKSRSGRIIRQPVRFEDYVAK